MAAPAPALPPAAPRTPPLYTLALEPSRYVSWQAFPQAYVWHGPALGERCFAFGWQLVCGCTQYADGWALCPQFGWIPPPVWGAYGGGPWLYAGFPAVFGGGPVVPFAAAGGIAEVGVARGGARGGARRR